MTHIRLERADQPDVVALIDELDAYQKPLYPPECHYGIDINALVQPNVLFAVARTKEGEAVGCAAVVQNGDWGEIKRMFVRPALRGQGVAQALVAFLEATARENGVTLVRLETGVLQPEALRFYERAGYARRGPFADYPDDPFSVFMEKRIQEQHA
jgi:putative acetyltransferase